MRRFKVAFSFVPIIIILFLSFISVINSKDVKVFKRGKVSLIDETQFKFPYEYEFTDDQDATDFDNAYDEKVPFLPKFVLHKNGFDQGYTRVPIVTRKGENTWSTPRPTTQRGEEYKTWGTPKILPITKPTPTRFDVSRTTPVPKTTFVAKAKFSLPPIKAEKPAKKPEVKATTASEEDAPVVTKLMKFFTRRPTTSTESTTTEATTTIIPLKKKFFTRRPTTAATSSSTEKSKEFTKSKERKPTTSASVEMITEEFTTDFTRKSFKKTKPTTTVSAEEISTSKKQFTRRPTTSTSASSEDPSTITSKKQFTRKPKPTSTEASTETSTEAATTRRKFTRKPTSTETTTAEASTEVSTRKKFTRKPTTSASASSEDPSTSTSRKQFTRRPRPSSTEASTESSTEASTTRKKFTRRPTTSTTTTSSEEHPLRTKEFFTKRLPTTSSSSASTEQSTEAATTKRKFTRKPKPSTTTEEPTTEATTMLPLKDRLRPMLTTREPTPTMPRRFRVFTNPAPAEAPTDELNPQQEIENQRKLKEKLSFGAGFNQEFSSKHAAKKRQIFVASSSSVAAAADIASFHPRTALLSSSKDVPIELTSKDTKLANFHFSKFAQRFGIRRIIPSYATTPQGSIIVTPVTASPAVVASINNGHGAVEQTVKSNAIILQPQKNPFFLPSDVTPNPSLFSSTTSAPQVFNQWSRSSSWSSSWNSNGQRVTSSNFETSDTTTPTTPSRTRSFSRTRTEPSTSSHTSSRTSTTRTSSSRAPFKPHVIHHGRHRYRGPTYNCRILTPNEDGRPSPNTDPSCPLKYPGFPADDSCRCRYDVEARDEYGCATGFLYTCKRVNKL